MVSVPDLGSSCAERMGPMVRRTVGSCPDPDARGLPSLSYRAVKEPVNPAAGQ